MSTAFQSNAFQGDAFQIGAPSTGVVTAGGPGPEGPPNQFVALYAGTIDPTMHKIDEGIAA